MQGKLVAVCAAQLLGACTPVVDDNGHDVSI